MRIAEVMTREVRCIAPDRSVREAARLMDELNVGVLPVCLDDRLVGMITDRDITVRSTAAGIAPDQQAVQEIMSTGLTSCREDEDAAAVLGRMSEVQVRRMPVVDGEGRLVGIVSLGDLAAEGEAGSGEALRRISTPSEPDLSGTLSSARADATRDHRPSPLTDEERRELERRMTDAAQGGCTDGGRAPDGPGTGAGGGLVFTDEENVRAAHGSFGNPAGAGGTGHMPGGLGGDGYVNYGRNFGRGADAAAPVPLEDAGHIGAPDEELDREGAEDRGPPSSGAPQDQDGRAGRVAFSSGPRDDADGRGIDDEPERGVDRAAATGNPGATGGAAGAAGGSPSGGRGSDG